MLNLIEQLLGLDVICHIGIKQLADNRMLAPLGRCLINIAGDFAQPKDKFAAEKAWELLKPFTTKFDTITVDPKWEKPYEIRCLASHLFATNEWIQFVSKSRAFDESFWERLILIPLVTKLTTYRPEIKEFDQGRKNIFMEELVERNREFLYQFAIDGLLRFIRTDGFRRSNFPNKVKIYEKKYMNWMAGRQDLGENVLDYLGSDQAKEFFARGKDNLARTKNQIYKDYVK